MNRSELPIARLLAVEILASKIISDYLNDVLRLDEIEYMVKEEIQALLRNLSVPYGDIGVKIDDDGIMRRIKVNIT